MEINFEPAELVKTDQNRLEQFKMEVRNRVLMNHNTEKGELVEGQEGWFVPFDHPEVTLVMRQLELRFSTPIDLLLEPGVENSVVARKLAVSPSTVSKWRKKLGLRA